MQIVLASGSKYKRQLIEKLGISVLNAAPELDETPYIDETSEQLAQRLSIQKAQALAKQYPAHWIIGSDQAAHVNGVHLSKPGDFATAKNQLHLCSGQMAEFYTGLCLLNSANGKYQYRCSRYQVQFRCLSSQQIEHYLKKEEPYDCAGSFKSEGLGIALFEFMRGDDPNSLIGLPLIELVSLLAGAGVDILSA